EVSEAYDVPAITNVGRRGGSGLAAALTNELIHVAKDVRTDDLELELGAEARAARNRDAAEDE
ncbi:precorrin-8X methylmutase, partial [Natrinema soli]